MKDINSCFLTTLTMKDLHKSLGNTNYSTAMFIFELKQNKMVKKKSKLQRSMIEINMNFPS